jgi:hypothetical protein
VIDQLSIRGVVPDDHVQLAVAVNVSQIGSVRPVERLSEIRREGKLAFTVVQEHAVVEWRVAPLRQHDIGGTIAVNVTDAHIGGCFACLFEQNHALEYPYSGSFLRASKANTDPEQK